LQGVALYLEDTREVAERQSWLDRESRVNLLEKAQEIVGQGRVLVLLGTERPTTKIRKRRQIEQ